MHCPLLCWAPAFEHQAESPVFGLLLVALKLAIDSPRWLCYHEQ